MRIRVGYELIYQCPQPTPMIVMLNIHFTRVSDIVIADHMAADPPVAVTPYRDLFGNWCSRIVAPPGRLRLAAMGVVNDTGIPDEIPTGAQQSSVDSLPDECLMFLLPTRYCDTDRLMATAWSLFDGTPPGW